jgi:hypothetical protein
MPEVQDGEMIDWRIAAVDHRALLGWRGTVVQDHNFSLRKFFLGHADTLGDIRGGARSLNDIRY